MSDASLKLRYTILDDGKAIQCHRCGAVSHHSDDVRARYCGACQRFHDAAQLPLPKLAGEIAESIAMVARTDICQGGEVTPAIMLMNTTKALMRHPVMCMEGPEERDRMAQEARLLADEIDADLAIVVSEAWAQPVANRAAMAALRAQYGDSIANMPDRQEILLLTVETAEHYWMGRAPITGAGLDRRCGEVQYEQSDNEPGRFTNFLCSAADKAALAATLAKARAALDAIGVDPDTQVRYEGARRRLIDILRRTLVKNDQYDVDDALLPATARHLAALVRR